MTQHSLQGRSDNEVLWHQRRSFLKAAASWTAMGGFAAAHAQARSNVVELMGDATLNGRRMSAQHIIQTGDEIITGPKANLIFVIGNAAFHVRQNSSLTVERGKSINTVSLLRLITGAVVSVWGKGSDRRIVTPTITAGIRGTGVYTEVFEIQAGRGYICNCYGKVEMAAGRDRAISQASYHQSFWGEVSPVNGRSLTPAKAINHTDEELEFLAHLIDQRTAWQIAGKKGVKDGMGMMESTPGQQHPADLIYRK
jgi:hypothetical protein